MMREVIFYIGAVEAEDRSRRERELGHDAHYLDSGVDPEDYSEWQVDGLSVLAYDLADSTPGYILSLAVALHRAGAGSILIFDREGGYLFRKTPFDGDLSSGQEPRACA
jgi:hypothetical protein